VTARKFRSLALGLPEAVESSHMDHPDFRVGNKIFATLGPREAWGMVKLTPAEQAEFIRREPEVDQPAAGAWGRQGCTIVTLKPAKVVTVRLALNAAWRNTAPKSLVAQHDAGERGASAP